MDLVPYRLPALVAHIVGEVGHNALARGITCDDVYFALWHQPDACQLLLAALTSGDFATLPRIQVRAVRLRYGAPMGDTWLMNIGGVDLSSDDCIASGDRVLMLLTPATIDAKSALRHLLLDNPQNHTPSGIRCRQPPTPDIRAYWVHAQLVRPTGK